MRTCHSGPFRASPRRILGERGEGEGEEGVMKEKSKGKRGKQREE